MNYSAAMYREYDHDNDEYVFTPGVFCGQSRCFVVFTDTLDEARIPSQLPLLEALRGSDGNENLNAHSLPKIGD